MDENKTNLSINQCHTLKLIEYIAQFHLIGFKKFTSCWHIKKDIFYRKITPHRSRNRLLTFTLGSPCKKCAHWLMACSCE